MMFLRCNCYLPPSLPPCLPASPTYLHSLRFHIDCFAPSNKDGVSLKKLIKESNGARKKAKLLATSADNATAVTIATDTAAATIAANREPPAAARGAPGAPGALTTTPAAAAAAATASSPAEAKAVPGAAGVTSGASDNSASGTPAAGGVVPAAVEEVAAAATEGTSPIPTADPPQQPPQPQPRKAKALSSRESRGRGWLDLIERLELENRIGTIMAASSSDASASGGEEEDENENDSGEDDGSDTGGGARGGSDTGGGGAGSSGSGSEATAGKSKPKAKRKKRERRHSFDYEDDFIDDSALVEAYYAKVCFFLVRKKYCGERCSSVEEEREGGFSTGGGAKGSVFLGCFLFCVTAYSGQEPRDSFTYVRGLPHTLTQG